MPRATSISPRATADPQVGVLVEQDADLAESGRAVDGGRDEANGARYVAAARDRDAGLLADSQLRHVSLRHLGIELDFTLLDHAEHGFLRDERRHAADATLALADHAIRWRSYVGL